MHDVEDLPKPRTPHLGQSAIASAVQPAQPNWIPAQVPPIAETPPPQTQTPEPRVESGTFQRQEPSQLLLPPTSSTPDYAPPRSPVPTAKGNSSRIRLADTRSQQNSSNAPSLEDDTASLNSFKTCPSEPNLSGLGPGLVPRQVSESYETRILGPTGSGHKSSFKGSKHEPPVLLRANAYAADPAPPRSPTGSAGSPGVGLPQLAESPEEMMPSATGSLGRSQRQAPPSHIRWKETNQWFFWHGTNFC